MLTHLLRCLWVGLLLLVPEVVLSAVGRTVGVAEVGDTGAATYSIPIVTPGGTAGLAPQLAFTYSSRNGSGPLGVGWGLAGLSRIERCASTWASNGSPRDVRGDAADRFCLDGVQLKYLSGPAYGGSGTQYRTEIESFARIFSQGAAGTGPAYFTVEQKSGLILEYGNTADSRVEILGTATARVWAVNKIRDRSGNAILFEYTKDSTHGSYRIDSVRYTANPAQGIVAPYAIKFVYETKPGTEIDTGYIAGSVVREIMRVDRVDVLYGTTLLRRYELTYEAALSSTSRSRLASLQECAGVALDCLPSTTFTYQSGTPGLGGEVNTGLRANPPWPLDVNGDGRDDLVYSSTATPGTGHWMVLLGGNSGYGSPINTGVVNSNYVDATPIDYNADGRDDLLVPYSGGTWWVLLGSAAGLSSPINTGAPVTATGRGLNARAIDVNGDGLEDLVWADLVGYAGGDAIRYRLREIGGAFSTAVYPLVGPFPADTIINDGVFAPGGQSGPRRAPDFNGDGRGDLFYKATVRVFNEATGRFRVFVSLNAQCSAAWGFGTSAASNASTPSFGDFNGDGKSDLVYFNSTGALMMHLSTGKSFAPGVVVGSIAPYGNSWAVLDWDSDGYEDLMLSHLSSGNVHVMRSNGLTLSAPFDTGLSGGPHQFYVADINGDGLFDLGTVPSSGVLSYRLHLGGFPDLLQSATDGGGLQASFSYAALSSYAFYYRGSTATYPAQEYSGPLQVVSNLRASNGIGGTYDLQSFYYENAHIDLQGRGFLGFSYRSWIDSRDGTAQRLSYRQDFPFTGSLTRQRRTQEPSAIAITEVQTSFSQQIYGSGIETRYLPYVSRSTQTDREVGGPFNGVSIRTVVTTNNLDIATGGVHDSTTTVTEGVNANGLNAGASYTFRTYSPTLFNDFANWCFGRPTRTQQIQSHTLYGGGAQTRTVDSAWDGLYCRPTQTVIEPGNATRQVITDLGYDAFGNLGTQSVTPVGEAARVTQFNWGADGRFPRTLTNALSQVTQLEWSAELGQLRTTTDPNGLIGSVYYDAFGRLTSEVAPDSTSTLIEYLPCDADCTGFAHTRYKVRSTLRDAAGGTVAQTFQLLDSLGRVRRSARYALEGGLIHQLTEYDAFGRIARSSIPYFHLTGTPVWTRVTYDLLDRTRQVTRDRTSDTDGSASTSTLDFNGLIVSSTDPLGKVRSETLDPLGQVLRVIQASGTVDQSTTSYDYDAFANLVRTTDALGNQVVIGYDVRGFKISTHDPDLGHWTYDYYPTGELKLQTDAKSQQTHFTYDKLSRPIVRVEPSDTGVSTQTTLWRWGDSAANFNIGQLVSMGRGDYAETHTYDNRSRLISSTIIAEGTYVLSRSYHSTTGLLETITYPASTGAAPFKVKYEYETANKSGLLQRVKDYHAGTVFWQATSTDAFGQYQDITLGNGVKTLTAFDSITGVINRIDSGAGGGNARQWLQYSWDKAGNLTSRQDLNIAKIENFTYDHLYRMTQAQVLGGPALSVAYNALGNITSKSDLGSYSYHPTKKHAVTTAGPLSLTYDANGNLETQVGAGANATVSWTAYNLPQRISDAAGFSSTFAYGPDRQRYKHVAVSPGVSERTIYVKGIFERLTRASGTEYKHSILGPEGVIAVHNRKSSGVNETLYLLKDHLGSTDVITNSSGASVLKLSYGPFGERRNPTTWSGSAPPADYTTLSNTTRLAFTGHEQIDNLDLIHMNGRVFHPLLGRFGSADPFVPDPSDSQSFNRYSYVGNNPLSFTDPSGFTPAGRTVRRYCQVSCGSSSGSASGSRGSAADGGASEAAADYLRRLQLQQIFERGRNVQCCFRDPAPLGEGAVSLGPTGGTGTPTQVVRTVVRDTSEGWMGSDFKSFALGFAAGIDFDLPTEEGEAYTEGFYAGLIANALTANIQDLKNGRVGPGSGRGSGSRRAASPAVNLNKSRSPVTSGGPPLRGGPNGGGSDPRRDFVLFHGTDVASAGRLLRGEALNAANAAARKIDGKPGFFLATDADDAAYFAARRGEGTVLRYVFSSQAVKALNLRSSPLGNLGKFGRFLGDEVVISPESFGTFNSLLKSGDIVISPN